MLAAYERAINGGTSITVCPPGQHSDVSFWNQDPRYNYEIDALIDEDT